MTLMIANKNLFLPIRDVSRYSRARNLSASQRLIITILRTDLDGAFNDVRVLEYLKPQVAVEVWIISEKFIDDIECLLRLLPADKGAKPAVDEKDLSRAFEVWQFC